LSVGAFLDGVQIGYARAASDKTGLLIMDVYVKSDTEDGHRTGAWYGICSSMRLKDVITGLLKTKDAHGVYAKCGFSRLRPSHMGTVVKPRNQADLPGAGHGGIFAQGGMSASRRRSFYRCFNCGGVIL
jgi:hypothetical protein